MSDPRSYNSFYSALTQERNNLTFKNNFTVSFEFLDNGFSTLPNFFRNIGENSIDSFNQNINYFIQEVNGTNLDTSIKQLTNEDIKFGSYSMPTVTEVEYDGKFTLTVVKTNLSYVEKFFYPWQQESVSEKWVYPKLPYSKANIVVTFYKQDNITPLYDIKYFDCFPISIPLTDATQSEYELNKSEVTFAYNFVDILPYDSSGTLISIDDNSDLITGNFSSGGNFRNNDITNRRIV